MTPAEEAFIYAERGAPVFPCRERDPGRKRPFTPRGFHDASRDPEIIKRWWRQWPAALIGMPTGEPSGVVVLDIDIKRPEANGFDSLEDLGIVLPATPMVHTASGGLHVYFKNPERELKCSAGLIGPGLDCRATGGYVVIPSPGSGYHFDPLYNLDSVELAEAPGYLWPPKPSRPIPTEPITPVVGLSRYGAAAIEMACNAIVRAGPGQQERTLNAECFSIGSLAGAGAVPADVALRALLKAGSAMPDHDAAWPWRPEEIDLKVRRAFNAGMTHPREVRRERVA
jgi:hypothetical protein